MINNTDYPMLRALIAKAAVEEYAAGLKNKDNPSYSTDDAENIKAKADCITRAYLDACGAADSCIEDNMGLFKDLELLDDSFKF